MTWEGWFTLGVIVLVFVALVRNWGPPDAVLLGGAILVGLVGIIPPEDVFIGFVNPGTLTIAALFVVAAAMRETGALDSISQWIFGKARTERSGLARMALPVAGMSAFLNNTPIVAMLMPVVDDWCRKNRISPSRLLMPLSFVAILGGTCTLIGTSTNLVINGLMSDAVKANPVLGESLRPLWLFEMTFLGVPFVLVGVLYLLFVGRHLLPDRKDLMEQVGESPREYLADMQIQPGCRLIGQGVEEAGLRHLPGLFLVEVVRGEEVIAPVTPEETLHEGDILTFTGVVSTMVDLERIQGLVPVADEGYEVRAAERRGKNLAEAVISASSPLIGKNIRDADFRATYNSAVIAVHRGGARLHGRIGDIVLQAGDTLLIQTGPHFKRAHHNNPDFYLVSEVEESRAVRHEKAYLCFGLMVLLVGLVSFSSIPVVLVAYTVAGLMLVARCVPAGVARQSIDWQTLLTIGAAFGLGRALDRSGGAQVLSEMLVGAAGAWGPYAVLMLIYGVTGFFACLVSNQASAVLMFPIALAAALAMEVSPRPYVMAVAFAAAATLATPLGYPTNLMVYGPGGYRFTDFTRVGLPLNLLLMVLATALIPRIWPF